MAKVKINYPNGSTPLDANELADLIPDYISTQGELNILEKANIVDAYLWADRVSLENLLTATFILEVHKKMFAQVWRWAGKQRRSNKNIGVSKDRIMQEFGVLLKDVEFWLTNQTYTNDEIATRFHHKLVLIHIFPNGNGRHARLVTNLLLKKMGEPAFTWGAKGDPTVLEVEGSIRIQYIQALKAADEGDFLGLLQFVRT